MAAALAPLTLKVTVRTCVPLSYVAESTLVLMAAEYFEPSAA